MPLSQEVKDKIENFVLKNFSNYCFSEDINPNDESEIFSQVCPEKEKAKSWSTRGATKIVLGIKSILDIGYVIKIPCSEGYDSDGSYVNTFNTDKSKSVRTWRTHGVFPFEHAFSSYWMEAPNLKEIAVRANFQGYDWDYCNIEAQITECYESMAIENFFAKTYYLCDIQNHPIYIQEYVPLDLYDIKISEKSYNDSKNFSSKQFDQHGISIFIENRSGEELSNLQDFLDFLEEFRIEDIHTGNIRIDRNGKARIVDYSGYRE